MTYGEFNTFCDALPATTYVMQWGARTTGKSAARSSAIGGWADDDAAVAFKVTEIAFEILRDKPGLRPAPYLASRGMTWMNLKSSTGVPGHAAVRHTEIRPDWTARSRG